jgi:hypothetical protein
VFSHVRQRLRNWLFSQGSQPSFCMHLLACCMNLYSSPAFVNSQVANGRSHLLNPVYRLAFEASHQLLAHGGTRFYTPEICGTSGFPQQKCLEKR